jgi:alkylation response protein AidB-like acyl-CoA dehydrogenase
MDDMTTPLFDEEHEMFRVAFREFLAKEVVPHREDWDRQGIVDKALFTAAGAAGFLGFAAPEQYGGGGIRDFRFNLVMGQEIQRAGVAGAGLGITLQSDICLPYFLDATDDRQREAWLPGICTGELVTAIAMSEPGAGSDLAAMTTSADRVGDHYVVNGAKTFISNGINADLIVTAVKTDREQRHAGISLLVIDASSPGVSRGRNLDKIGMHAQDTAELFFDNVEVPAENLLGTEGSGFGHLVRNLPQERLSIAASGTAAARAAFEWTLEYCQQRNLFGRALASFQNSRFKLAELATEIEIAETFIDRCVLDLNAGRLTPERAAMAKFWCTELQGRAVDLGVQLHGGYGYMAEYPIARAYVDARVARIYGGANEVMLEIIGRTLG